MNVYILAHDQCYCPCLTYVTHTHHKINKDPFEEQKILFDLERARGFSTESSVSNTDLPSSDYDTTTFRQVFRRKILNISVALISEKTCENRSNRPEF